MRNKEQVFLLEICAVAKTKAGILQPTQAIWGQLLPQELLPKEKGIVRHITLAGGRNDKDYELMLQHGTL